MTSSMSKNDINTVNFLTLFLSPVLVRDCIAYPNYFADGNGSVCRIIIGTILMKNNCPPIFPEITNQEEQIEYITTIVNCEREKSDTLLMKYFAEGMTDYLLRRINE